MKTLSKYQTWALETVCMLAYETGIRAARDADKTGAEVAPFVGTEVGNEYLAIFSRYADKYEAMGDPDPETGWPRDPNHPTNRR